MGLRQLAVCAGCGQGVETLREPCGGEDSAASCPVQSRAAGGLSERAGDGIAPRKPLQAAGGGDGCRSAGQAAQAQAVARRWAYEAGWRGACGDGTARRRLDAIQV